VPGQAVGRGFGGRGRRNAGLDEEKLGVSAMLFLRFHKPARLRVKLSLAQKLDGLQFWREYREGCGWRGEMTGLPSRNVTVL
jgi:hypothetical protein